MEVGRWLASGLDLLCPAEAGSSRLLYGNLAAKASCRHASGESKAARSGSRNQDHAAGPVQRVGMACRDADRLLGSLGAAGHSAGEHRVREEAPVVR